MTIRGALPRKKAEPSATIASAMAAPTPLPMSIRVISPGEVASGAESSAKASPIMADNSQARIGGAPEDYLDVDEAFAQIAGMDMETWRKRVEKHKQTCPD